MRLALDGGTRTPLALPRDCGTHVIKVRLISHAGAVRDSEHPVTVGGCRVVPVVSRPRVERVRGPGGSSLRLRWTVRGAHARTDVTLQRLVRGRWHELGRRAVAAVPGTQILRVGSRWRGVRLGVGRYRFELVAVAADGSRSLAEHVDLRPPR
jgi:hypothetical protein